MLLKPHLTPENHEEWLFLACEKSKRQVERLVASRCPQPDAAVSIRKLPTAAPVSNAVAADTSARQLTPGADTVAPQPIRGAESTTPQLTPGAKTTLPQSALDAVATPQVAVAKVAQEEPAVMTTLVVPESNESEPLHAACQPAAASRGPTSKVAPLSSCTYRVTFTASEALKQKLDRASELLSHCIQPSDLPTLIERALDQLIEREQRRRYGAKAEQGDSKNRRHGKSIGDAGQGHQVPRHPEQTHDSCQIRSLDIGVAQDPDPDAGTKRSERRQPAPAAVRREVWVRDEGQCTFIDNAGRRCSERHFLELDHIKAHAIGGTETEFNLRLRCACHNRLEAEALFGRRLVDSAVALSRRKRNAG